MRGCDRCRRPGAVDLTGARERRKSVTAGWDHGPVHRQRRVSQPLAEAEAESVLGADESGTTEGTWPSPIRDRAWFGQDGQLWRMRGDRLAKKGYRRLKTREDIRVLHCYGMHPVEVTGGQRESLFRRVDTFLNGDAPPMRAFDLAEFRNVQRDTMLVIEEFC